jgi:vitamin B12/bleomycin/antimicrobial peptide transport system ATP-binding/permease protein
MTTPFFPPLPCHPHHQPYCYVRDYLGMHWREWLTGEFLGNYFKNRNYYEIEADGSIDNPDQRIMEDIRSFTRT